MSIPSFGSSFQYSDLNVILNDLLNGMGDYLDQQPGSLNWIECLVNAKGLAQDKAFITLMANQLSPSSSSVYLDDWSQIYNISSLQASPFQQQQYIEQKQAQFNTPPTLSNLISYFQKALGNIFIDLEIRSELQNLATTDPTIQISLDGYAYSSPLSTVMVYCWQPRDNQDNLLIPNNFFNQTVESYHPYIQAWNPAYLNFQTQILHNLGNQDGYGGGYNGNNFNNYIDGYNVISGTAGSLFMTGTNTTFKVYPNGNVGDIDISVNAGYTPPIQIVDDLGQIHTYYVLLSSSNTSLTLTTPLINNITNRTYRLLGCVTDVPGVSDSWLLNC